MNTTIRIATRESPLALWQANFIRQVLLKQHPRLCIELLPMRTTGDAFLKDKLQVIGGKGHFVKELEEALLDRRADIAVHSMKDVPVSFPQGLWLPIICKRDNPFDAFVSAHFSSIEVLPVNATVGTASLRRQAQLLAQRPDIQIQLLRGNVQTRLKKLDAGEYDAILLACAGLERLNLSQRITAQLDEAIMLPACGQGALGIECRENDDDLLKLLQPLNDSLSQRCVQTERQVNAELGGSCHAPLAVYCKPIEKQQLSLQAKVFSPDGKIMLSVDLTDNIDNSMQLALNCANILKQKGALALIEQAEKSI